MKLNDTDKENIEVLESLDVDENTLLKLLFRYFAYRHKRINEQYGYTPNQALQATVRWGMMNYGNVNVDASFHKEEQSLPLDDPKYIESLKWANNLLNRFAGDENPYHGVPHWEQTWDLLHQMELTHVMSSAVDRVYVLGDIYLGTVDQVAKMSREDVRRIIDASKHSQLDEITHIADDAGLYD